MTAVMPVNEPRQADERSQPWAPREAHLWAIVLYDPRRAEHTRAEITALAGADSICFCSDRRHSHACTDGSYTLNRESFPLTGKHSGRRNAPIFGRLGARRPMTGRRSERCSVPMPQPSPMPWGIEDAFIRDVERLMKLGTSTLLVLDDQGDMEVILQSTPGWRNGAEDKCGSRGARSLNPGDVERGAGCRQSIPNGDPK